MPERELPKLMEDLAGVIDQQTAQIHTLQSAVDEQNEQLKNFVPKSKARWIIAVGVVVLAALIGAYVYFRVQDRHRDEKRRDETFLAQESDRQSSIRGCERANDVRRTLRDIIETAFQSTPTPLPPALSPELTALIRQSQERSEAKRDELLHLPGVQNVDCEAQYPPLLRQKA